MNHPLPRVRIAPSPTGLLHIGTARTALFNYLFARRHKGEFLLRIEDTDRQRSKKEYEEDILEGLRWLGLKWDGKLIRQSQRLEIYRDIAARMVKRGLAYQKDGAIYYKIRSPATTLAAVEFKDLVRGPMRFALDALEDFVILKSDGHPTYHFGVVVDDEAMDITHVIRGEDHLSNTPKHILMQHALGYRIPTYVHLPLIVNRDRSKMSKRRDPVSVTRDFRHRGYLPEAMLNFMALLGWNPGGGEQQEFFTLDELIGRFSFEHVGHSPSVFDPERLNYFNAKAIRAMDGKALLALLKTFGPVPKKPDDFLRKVTAVLHDRLATLGDFRAVSGYFFRRPTPSGLRDLLVFKTSSRQSTQTGLTEALTALTDARAPTWEKVAALNEVLKGVVERGNLKAGDVFWPVRVALSGEQGSPSPAELLWVLGRRESLGRLKEALRLLPEPQEP